MKKYLSFIIITVFFSHIILAQNGYIEVDEDARIGLENGSFSLTDINYTNAFGLHVGDAGGLFDNNNGRLNLISTGGITLGVNEPNGFFNAMDIKSDGRIGINTVTTSSSTVHIKQSLNGYTLKLDRDGGLGTHLVFASDNANQSRITYDPNIKRLRFYNPINSIAMDIDSLQIVRVKKNLVVGTENGTYTPAYSGYTNPLGIVIGNSGYIVDADNGALNLASLNGFNFLVDEDGTNPIEIFNITSAGYTGINVHPSTNSTLHIHEIGNGTTMMLEADYGYNPNIIFRSNGNNAANIKYNDASERLDIQLNDGNNLQNVMVFEKDGDVGIGTTAPGNYKLAVEGNIGAREVEVKTGSWADFVFDKNYKLMPLEEVQTYISANGHLPDVPSEKEALSKPHNLGSMDVLLLQKVEELTLYTIEQQELINTQADIIKKMDERLKTLEGK